MQEYINIAIFVFKFYNYSFQKQTFIIIIKKTLKYIPIKHYNIRLTVYNLFHYKYYKI